MKDILTKAVKIFGWLVLLAAFSALGFITDNPSQMVPLYFLFFLVVFTLVFLYNLKKKRKRGNKTHQALVKKILGVFLVVVAVLTPYYIFRQVGFTFTIYAMITIVAIALIILGALSVVLIKRPKLIEKILGYIALLVICSVPALMMIQYDRSYNALGTAYYGALIVATLSWWGIDIFLKSVKE